MYFLQLKRSSRLYPSVQLVLFVESQCEHELKLSLSDDELMYSFLSAKRFNLACFDHESEHWYQSET